MPKEKKEVKEEVTKPVEVVAPVEYTVQELASHSEAVFGKGVSDIDVEAAFFVAGKDKATKEEAKTIVEKFKNKEVR